MICGAVGVRGIVLFGDAFWNGFFLASFSVLRVAVLVPVVVSFQ